MKQGLLYAVIILIPAAHTCILGGDKSYESKITTRGAQYMIKDWQTLAEIHNHDLEEFFKAANIVARNASFINQLGEITTDDYFTFYTPEQQRRHQAAYQRATFEIKYALLREGERTILTNVDYYKYLAGQGTYHDTWTLLEPYGTHFMWGKKTLEGIRMIEQRRIDQWIFEEDTTTALPFPILDTSSEAHLYGDEKIVRESSMEGPGVKYSVETGIVEAFNENTALQYLYVVQQRIDAIFALQETNIAMKYHLLSLAKQAAINKKCPVQLYLLAYVLDSTSSKDEKKSKRDALKMVSQWTKPRDWVFGRTIFFWERTWREQGVISYPLPLEEAAMLYIKFKGLESARQKITKEYPAAKQEFINDIIMEYLENNSYGLDDILDLARQKKATEGLFDAVFAHLFSQSKKFITTTWMFA